MIHFRLWIDLGKFWIEKNGQKFLAVSTPK